MKSGRYNCASEGVREALRLLEQRDEVFTLRKDEIRKQIEEGWLSAKRSEIVDGDDVFDRIDSEFEALRAFCSEMKRFILTGPAERDLDRIKSYLIGKAGPRIARTVFQEIRSALNLLGTNPEIGHTREDLTDRL